MSGSEASEALSLLQAKAVAKVGKGVWFYLRLQRWPYNSLLLQSSQED